MSDTPRSVLFLCTGNSARSILAEALLNHKGGDSFRGLSAGSQPKGAPHPMALETLERHGFSTAGLRPKSWDEFAEPGAPQLDFIFTVCDNAAGEACPVWPGHPASAHWGIADPAAIEGDGQRAAFEEALRLLEMRIDAFLALPHDSLDRDALTGKLADIGKSEGSTIV
ncbi:arsenate reductase ArsC [Parasphingopyxis sp.]|uniref:arsenate reductase ArsC n=1 Tax=Parasphingopyxis sp. TaxID=1920299 RepID=UPI00262F9768|nr:arsenate reductase ArsC [Parasphingopyxis sp.]